MNENSSFKSKIFVKIKDKLELFILQSVDTE